jgi:RNA polymerase sigma-70 factor, ECF subfamily
VPLGGLRGPGEMGRSDSERREGFEAEVLPHLDAAYRLARVLTGGEQNAEDLVQAACLRAFVGFNGYRRGTNARAWLLTILRRTYLNELRKDRKQPQRISLERESPGGTPLEVPDTLSPGPEEQMLRKFDRELILNALAGLPEAYRSALALVDIEGLRYAEAANILGCPAGTVMSRLSRGRELLAQRLHQQLMVVGDAAADHVFPRGTPTQRTSKRKPLAAARALAMRFIHAEAGEDD